MNAFDWIIVISYLGALLGMSFWMSRGQGNARDYYLAGNKTGPLPIALSTVATQCSTNSLLGAPAFVAFAVPGGLLWLQYELAVPIAMAVLVAVLYPVFRSLQLVSLYEYLEHRFGVGTRIALSVVFQILRGFSTGVLVYGASLVISEVMGLPFWAAVLLLGGITVTYDVMGGMKAVIWSDVIQIVILFGAILAAIAIALNLVGGWSGIVEQVSPDRLRTLDFSGHGLGDGAVFAFWPMLIGGLFLYVAYYGCDQTQAQRELSTRDGRDTTRALAYDGLLRFPLVVSYCFLGLCLAAYAALHPEFLQELPLRADGEPNTNLAVPAFVLNHFPHGAIGLVMVGLFAAAMSSLDSTLNALSALTMQDLIQRLRREKLSDRAELLVSKGVTVVWGVFCLLSAFFVEQLAETVIEAVNKVSSFLNGPLLATFLLGLCTRRANQTGAIAGLIAGFAANGAVAMLAPEVSWLWWNVIGCLTALAVGYAASLPFDHPRDRHLDGTTVWSVGPAETVAAAAADRQPWILTLLGYALFIFLALFAVTAWAQGRF